MNTLNTDSIETLLENSQIKKTIECFHNENKQNDIHVLDTFNDLVNVGEYIGIADKGTEGSSINIQVKDCLNMF